MSRRDDRKREIAALRLQGREAFEAGKTRQALPRKYVHSMDGIHWIAGYDWAALEAENAKLEGGAE